MFILLIFLAELSAAILAFIFRENVSIQRWAISGPQRGYTQLEQGVRWCLICLYSGCFKYQQTFLVTALSAELAARQGMLSNLASAGWRVYVDTLIPEVFRVF